MSVGVCDSRALTQLMSSTKQLQSGLKQSVQSYGKLILSWQQDVEMVQEILDALARGQRALDGVRASAQRRQLVVFDRFPDLQGKLEAALAKELEQKYLLLRQSVHGMGDVIAALSATANDALQSVLGQDAEGAFPADAIFTAEHVLEMQSLQARFALEYQRKQRLIESLLSLVGDGEAEASSDGIAGCSSSWGDCSGDSLLSADLLRAFLLQNAIV